VFCLDMFIESDINLANKYSAFLLMIFALCAGPSIPGRTYDQEPSAKFTEYFVKRVLGLTN